MSGRRSLGIRSLGARARVQGATTSSTLYYTSQVASHLRRERNPNWKGGRVLASNGYVLVRRPDHPLADVRGYVYEHRLVAEEKLGRSLRKGEQVHHRNGVKHDNRPENLEVMSRVVHAVEHRRRRDLRLPTQENPMVECACGCGAAFLKYDETNRPRRFISGHNFRGGDG